MTTKTRYHEVCSWFPRLGDADRQVLKNDIHQHGCHTPAVSWQGQIIDGRHRIEICEELGLNCPVKQLTGTEEDAIRYAISANLHRRHLSTEQRGLIAAQLANLDKGRPKINASTDAFSKDIPSCSQEQAAERLNVSRRTVQRASQVLSEGAKPIVDAVRNGEVSMTDAAAIVDLPKSEQVEALKEVKAGESDTLREAAGRKPPKPPTRTTKAKPEPKEEKGPLLDELEKPVPSGLATVFQKAVEFKALLNAMSQCTKKAHELAESPAGVRLKNSIQRVQIGIKDARRVVRFDAPYCVCPVCNGSSKSRKANCPCRNTGWLTEAEYGQLPTEYRG